MDQTLTNEKTKASFDVFKQLAFHGLDQDKKELAFYDVGHLEEDKMMAHILECLAALAEKQRLRVALKQPLTLTAAQQVARNKVFRAALALLAGGLTHDGAAADDEHSAAVREVSRAFPDAAKQTDGRGWLPLHWAVATVVAIGTGDQEHGVTEADVKELYELDPLALCRYHLESDDEYDTVGFTPAHLLCMLEMTEQTKALVRFFSVSSPQSFNMNVSHPQWYGSGIGGCFGALHVACRYGQPTEWLVQQLLQLNSSACKVTSGFSTLNTICGYSARVDEGALRCLLAVDSSMEVVHDGMMGCFSSRVLTNRVEAVTLMLEVNPQAARYKDGFGRTPAHWACFRGAFMTAQESIDILTLLVALHKNAFKEEDNMGFLPIHELTQQGPVEALEYLLGACPEVPATVLTAGSSKNLLHCALDGRKEVKGRAAKVKLLCSRYPAMMLQRNYYGGIPIETVCRRWQSTAEVALALCEAGGRELASTSVVPFEDYDDHDDDNGWLPLHYFINCRYQLKTESLLSPWADVFRLLLRLYPEAAGVEAGRGTCQTTPYQLAVDNGLPAYYRRLLLHAAPALDPAKLRRLNWAERRMAMFVAFKATFPKGPKPPLLARFRLENHDVLKLVVSYL